MLWVAEGGDNLFVKLTIEESANQADEAHDTIADLVVNMKVSLRLNGLLGSFWSSIGDSNCGAATTSGRTKADSSESTAFE